MRRILPKYLLRSGNSGEAMRILQTVGSRGEDVKGARLARGSRRFFR
jgi:t-SNARE complex subunit (syntaxin)